MGGDKGAGGSKAFAIAAAASMVEGVEGGLRGLVDTERRKERGTTRTRHQPSGML